MNLKYNCYLFTELVQKYIKTKDMEIKNELYDRMNFCGFNSEMIKCFIDLEKLIINFTKITFDEPLYNKFYWFKNKKNIFNNNYNEIFMINSNIVTKNTLSFSECICLLDEATYMLTLFKDIEDSLKNELKIFYENDKNKFIRKELTYRFMMCYDKINHNDNEMPIEYFYKINKFINNELRIINLCKWIYPSDKQNSIKFQWKPYTKEYYEYYN